MTKRVLVILGVIGLACLLGILWLFNLTSTPNLPSVNDDPVILNPSDNESVDNNFEPKLEIRTIVEGLSNPWDVVDLPDNSLLFTQRSGGIFFDDLSDNRKAVLIEKPEDLVARGEGGMMSIALARDFEESRELFVCFNSNKDELDIRVVRYTLTEDQTKLENREDIVIGMPANPSGRHSGCRLEVDQNNILWIGTGDAAVGTNPQNPKSLGGKILRVDHDGQPVAGNLAGEFDQRIFSFGHRNTQGIAITSNVENDIYGFSAEHGSFQDDEVNPIVIGNFGWNPVPGYNENVPMTDKNKYPQAVEAVWKSGLPTIAISGLTFIEGEQWGNWDGSLLMAVQKNKHIRLLKPNGREEAEDLGEILENYGRIRSLHKNNDGDILFTTDNGNGRDIIGKITPRKE